LENPGVAAATPAVLERLVALCQDRNEDMAFRFHNSSAQA